MKILDKLKKYEFQDKQGWIEDAKFGLDQISDHIIDKKNFNVLEVGCGLGILLSLIKEKYKNIHCNGIEPFGQGFDRLNLEKSIISKHIYIDYTSFENFNAKKKYDLIFSINVFEHLTNWELYIKKMHKWLKKDGVSIILCPNYSFPYESHFKLPIIFNKKLTEIIFKKSILNFEKEKNAVGLWESLNFIKMNKIKSFCNTNNLFFEYDKKIFDTIINRYDQDPEFRKRQNTLGKLAKLFKKIGILKLLKLKPFHKFHPYMKIKIKKNLRVN